MMLYEDNALTTRKLVIVIVACGALPTIMERVMVSIGRSTMLEKPLSSVCASQSHFGSIPIFLKVS